MASEKIVAGGAGMLSAGLELAMLPGRLLQIGARPAAWTPAGWMTAWAKGAGLVIGVGNAALHPAKTAAVRNRARLASKRG